MSESLMIDTGVQKQNLFPGIRPFSSAEDKFFFGRDDVSQELVERLKEKGFVALVGASGSGKSSLIQAGVIPRLLNEMQQEWVPISIQPGLKPMESLVRGFQRVFPKNLKHSDTHHFLSGSLSLGEFIHNKGLGDHNYLIVVDQFEEIFRPGPDAKPRGKDPETRRFVKLLAEAVTGEHPNIYVLLSIRSDFLEASAAFKSLTGLMNKNKYLIPQMTSEALSETITGPADLAGASLESGFLDLLQEDIDDLDMPLPRVQYFMKRVWDTWLEQGRWTKAISQDDYQAAGTVKTALQGQLEEAYAELNGLQKLRCERLFKSIAFKSEQQGGFCRRISMGSLARIAQCSVEDLGMVVDVFRRPGREFILPAGSAVLNPESLIELSHESLIQIWDRLRDWVTEEAESIKMYLELSDASARYQQGRTELWEYPILRKALEWRDSQKPTPAWGVQHHPAFERAMVFLKTSEEEVIWKEERKIIQQKRRRLINRGMAVLMSLIIVSLAVVFIVIRNNARNLPETEVAVEQHLTEATDPIPAGPVEQSGQEEISQIGPLPEEGFYGEEASLPEDLPAENQRNTAPPPEVERPPNRESSASSAGEAVASLPAAAMQLLAKDVSVQSMAVSQDPVLQGLLAYQAYKIHSAHAASVPDNDIYRGMYLALKKLISPAATIYQGVRASVKDIQWLNRTGSILIANSDGSLKILSGHNASTSRQINLTNTGQKNECLLLSPDENLAAVGTNGGGLLFLELENEGRILRQKDEEGNIILFLSSIGRSGDFLSAGTDNRIMKWNFSSGEAELFIHTHARVSALTSSQNGQNVSYGTRDGKLFELKISDPTRQTLIGDFGRVSPRAIAYSPSGNNMVVGLRDGSIAILSGTLRQKRTTLKGPQASITDVVFSPDGRFLAAASNDGKVYLWSAADWTNPPLVFDENKGFVLSVCFSGNSAYFYSGSVDYPRLVGCPAEASGMAGEFCSLVDRNLTRAEWTRYFGNELPYEETCPE